MPGRNGWWIPLLGGHHLTAGFDWLTTARGHLPWIFPASQFISLLPHLAVWAGMALVVWRSRQWLTRARPISAADHLALASIFTAICQGLLDGLERLPHEPHYMNATWIAYLVLAWYATDALLRRGRKIRLAILAPVGAYIASMLIVMGFTIARIHRDGGTTALDYGTTLGAQISATRQLQKYSPDSPIDMQYFQWRAFPWAKDELLNLLVPASGPREKRLLLIRYRNAFPGDAHIQVVATSDSPPLR
jgi:hypothetical protein